MSRLAPSPWACRDGIYSDPRMTALGLNHGVTTRALGDMKEPSERAAALGRAGLGGAPVFLLKQVHGTAVFHVDASSRRQPRPEGDGWVTDVVGKTLGIFAADCMPIYLWAPAPRAAGVVHAGWRGAQAGMIAQAVLAFRTHYGVGPERLSASIGPHIGPCCYRVGAQTAAQFDAAAVIHRRGEVYLDLGAAAKAQLIAAGLGGDAVTVSDACTSCLPALFFSFRRDKNDRRMMAFLSLE